MVPPSASELPPQTHFLTNQAAVPAAAQPEGKSGNGQEMSAVASGAAKPPPPQISAGMAPNLRGADLDRPVPALPDFRHEDIRPATDGERLGPQGKFSGATNEYREDWGRELTRAESNRERMPLAEAAGQRGFVVEKKWENI